ncbi:HNH endonuclease [Bacillus phage Moonbeam]|uniref:Homing endonuclease n=1 Tax=Bacillus phage Moonbeam TaxID=1540091 RepID=A0A0A0RN70_9CAUD|nr:HNH endonuclease [Bacillus phage Moonbeam]AIW03515.1 homing endonuclease [Bacillus phage Moonbeam]
MIIPKEERSHSNYFYRKLYRVWWHITQRCYKESAHDYVYYGAKGVHMCDKWKDLDGFFDDVDKVPGWDKAAFLAGELVLDKDLKIRGNKCYGPEGCQWVSPGENASYIPSKMKDIVALSPEGQLYEFFNMAHFAEEHGLNTTPMKRCLDNDLDQHHGWQFCYKKDYQEGVFKTYEELYPVVVAMDTKGEIFKFKNPQEAANHIINGYAGNISEALQGKKKHVKGWQVCYLSTYYEGKFTDPSKLKNVSGKMTLAIDPKGNTYTFTNRVEFSKEHGIDSRRIGECVNGKRNEYRGWKFELI